MNARVISRSNPTLSICSKPNHSPGRTLPNNISSISFSFQVMKSKNFLKTTFESCRCRSSTRIEAMYVPAESNETLYELLGIADTENATLADIKKAYKRMARKYHPDVAPPDKVDEYTKLFIRVREAYETLSDPHKRALYDEYLAAGSDRKLEINDQKMAGHECDWKMRWQAQLEELKRQSEVRSRERSRSRNKNV